MNDAQNDENAPPAPDGVGGAKKRKKYGKEIQSLVFQQLLLHCDDPINLDTIRHGSIASVASTLAIPISVVSRIYQKCARAAHLDQNPLSVLEDRRAGNARPSKYDKVELVRRFKEAPIEKRSTIRDSASFLEMPYSTYHLYSKRDKIFRSSSIHLKPRLTEAHRRTRVEFATANIGPDGFYTAQYDTIHIDEKWFYLDKLNRRV
jgi:hypothetical protein